MRIVVLGVMLFVSFGAFALNVGDPHPGLDGYSIDNSADYHGPWLDIQDYLDAGKCVIASHWKQS